jgi:hypothetical protein
VEPLMASMLKSTGRLRKRLLPAVYFDPSFFSRYALAAFAAESPAAAAVAARAAERLPPLQDGEEAAFRELARLVAGGGLGVTPLVSSLTLLRFMQELALVYRQEDPESRKTANREETDFEGMRFQSWLNRLLGDSLDGLAQVDLTGFALPVDAVWEEGTTLVLVDSAERCSIHALAARHLGCTWLATVLPEMVRVGEVLQASGGPRPLRGPQAVLTVLATRSAQV